MTAPPASVTLAVATVSSRPCIQITLAGCFSVTSMATVPLKVSSVGMIFKSRV